MKKKCNKCQQEKPIALFYWSESRRQYSPSCKVCARNKQKEARKKPKTEATTEQNTKQCIVCCNVKPLDCFYVDERGVHCARCFDCNIPWSNESTRKEKRAKVYKKKDVDFLFNRLHLNGGDY